MDGARISNAAAALGVPLRAFTTRRRRRRAQLRRHQERPALRRGDRRARTRTASTGLIYLRKLNMQLASKMRFVSAQLIALLEGDLWLRSAPHANAMAARLRAALEAGIADGVDRGVAFSQPTQANAVFATLPTGVADRLRERFRFYDWDAAKARCAGCAPSTPPRPTSTRSSPPSSRAGGVSSKGAAPAGSVS